MVAQSTVCGYLGTLFRGDPALKEGGVGGGGVQVHEVRAGAETSLCVIEAKEEWDTADTRLAFKVEGMWEWIEEQRRQA